jgi:hypothetical protein
VPDPEQEEALNSYLDFLDDGDRLIDENLPGGNDAEDLLDHGSDLLPFGCRRKRRRQY